MTGAGKYMVVIDQEELNTLLSALRLYQQYDCPEMYDDAESNLVLGAEEIDDLCERINCSAEAPATVEVDQ